jgi:N-methylhydantoinase B
LRDPEAVREDVLDEYVSIAAARERYGVVLNGSLDDWDIAIDVDKTAQLRRARLHAKATGGAQ